MLCHLSVFLATRRWFSIRVATIFRTLEMLMDTREQVQGPVLVEDTCLCFDAFDELPGPYVYAISKTLTVFATQTDNV